MFFIWAAVDLSRPHDSLDYEAIYQRNLQPSIAGDSESNRLVTALSSLAYPNEQ